MTPDTKIEDSIRAESVRIENEYARRAVEVDADLYAPWQPGEILLTAERKRIAATMLHKLGKFPKAGSRCLEVGYGQLGWLADLLSWRLNEDDLYGIELDAKRARCAMRALPGAHLKVGDATALPWKDGYFDLIVVSTVFSSMLRRDVRTALSAEIDRVLSPGGTVLVYDLAVGNPRNKNLLRVDRGEIRAMFSNYVCHFRSLSLAPPIGRPIARISWPIATILSSIPFLRTHFLGVLVRN
jgi:ubiquinone/menaquinone biosynthesis C-methylase UbiE